MAVLAAGGFSVVGCSESKLDLDNVVVACVSTPDEVDALMTAAIERVAATQQRVGQLSVARTAPGVEAVVAPGSSETETDEVIVLMEALPNVVTVVRDRDDC